MAKQEPEVNSNAPGDPQSRARLNSTDKKKLVLHYTCGKFGTPLGTQIL